MRKWNGDGGEDFESRGLERQIAQAMVGMTREAHGCPSIWEFKTPSFVDGGMDGYLRGSSGTPNHRFGIRCWYYLWAMRAGSSEQQEDARALVLEFMVRQRTIDGYMLGEFLTTSHYQIWLQEMTCLRAMAIFYADQEVIDETTLWFRSGFSLHERLLVDGAYVRSPGPRPAGDHSELRTVFHAMLKGKPAPPRLGNPSRPITGRPNEANGPFWRNAYNVGAWAARELMKDGDDFGIGDNWTQTVQLRDTLILRRRHTDYVFEIPHFTKSGPNVLPWIARIGTAEKTAAVHRGRVKDWDSPYPAPSLPDATVEILQGVGIRSADLDGDDEDEDEAA